MDAFWFLLARDAVRVGLNDAAKLAAQTVGVDRSTASRWLYRTKLKVDDEDGAGWRLLWYALHLTKGRYEVPTPEANKEWRKIRGWAHLQRLGIEYEEPRESVALWWGSRALWMILLEAAAVASVVVGNASALRFASISDATSPGMEALRQGGLLGRQENAGRFTYWLKFGLDEKHEPRAVAIVCTRTRMVGLAGTEFPQMPQMSLRLDPDSATKIGARVLIPVPSATIPFHHTPLKFPLDLDLSDDR